MLGEVFSSRLPPSLAPNRLARVLARRRTERRPLVDLTVSNPTLAEIDYPADLLAPLASADGLRYAPEPLGLHTAREAVALEYTRLGAAVDPARVVLTSSTSEAYAWLFKLLCDPGDEIVVPQPGYPLFEHLGRLDAVVVAGYALEPHAQWTIDRRSVAMKTSARTRAVLVVAPNNPTGSRLAFDDWQWLDQWCATRDIAVIVDEVFADYAIHPLKGRVATVTAAPAGWSPRALTVALGGLSKSCGLPQVKVGWMVVGGDPGLAARAIERLEIVADTYLPVSTPAQLAVPVLLGRAGVVRERIAARLGANVTALQTALAGAAECSVLVPEAGWSAVVRVPSIGSEEDLVVDLVEREGVLVHPGYFFDFPFEAFLVVSLLTPTRVLSEGMARVAARIATRLSGRGSAAVTSPTATGRP